MKAHWQQLDQKEKQLVSLLIATLLLACGYWLVWQPLQNDISNTQRKVNVQTQTLADVKVIGQKIMNLQGGQVNHPEAGDLNQLVSLSAKRNKIMITRIQAKADNLQVWIDDVNFNQLTTWLEQLNKQYGIEIQNIDLSVSDKKGMVKVRRLQLGKRA
ncbi:type II secretion system protein GspM [Moritella viscosa]|uniref:Type II secretion system protein M n=1 Tax=Moritella viscosa TaxID=80854 RepID=A0A090ICH7_9GAMM|nr:type II secretion system protein M [Moritella viscosa]CED58307.1 general secretion pathway protein M [Moritella viscosa]SGY94953.1 General secretion pathway protein M [Moritella viscosa]SGZ00126.1 General secretion pathway protein M [Moritella viscosa]SGZ00569.1 General secretion pathway protein M [Moritella viscosa]SGZ06567.1 General secretion pathway protein M [Moritella viscosa]